jgi:DNA-binding NarL/FixJ family response regulator
VLGKDPQIEVVGEAADGRAAADLTSALNPDVVLMDLTMPVLSGIQAIRLIMAGNVDRPRPDGGTGARETKVIAVSLHADSRMVAEAVAAGADGYVLKNNVVREIVPAIRAVLAGQNFMSSKLAAQGGAGDAGDAGGLSDGERDVLRLSAEGRTDSDIIFTLRLNKPALDQCRRDIMAKLRLQSPAEWARFLRQRGAGSSRAGDENRSVDGSSVARQ